MNISKIKNIIQIDKIPAPNSLTNDVEFMWSIRKIYKGKLDISKINIKHIDYIPSAGDHLYFYPGCTVPRYKVRDWAQKLGMSVTIKEENADIKFVSNDSVIECLSNRYIRKVNKTIFIQWLDINYDSGRSDIILLKDEIKNCPNKCVYLSSEYSGYYGSDYIGTYITGDSRAHAKGFKKSLVELDPSIDYSIKQTLYIEKYDTLISLLSDDKICLQERIIELINENSTIIDQNMYARLQNMLDSTNEADKILAIEIIANCNINPSLHHVLLLFQANYNTILNMKESNHVNFKSLLEYIGITRQQMCRITDDNIITYLLDKDVLTYNTVKELAEGVKMQWIKDYDTKHFKISTITVSDEVKKHLKKKQQKLVN